MTSPKTRRLTTWACARGEHHACDRGPRLLLASMGPHAVCECACHDEPRQTTRQPAKARRDDG